MKVYFKVTCSGNPVAVAKVCQQKIFCKICGFISDNIYKVETDMPQYTNTDHMQFYSTLNKRCALISWNVETLSWVSIKLDRTAISWSWITHQTLSRENHECLYNNLREAGAFLKCLSSKKIKSLFDLKIIVFWH